MAPSAPEDDGAHSRKRSRRGERTSEKEARTDSRWDDGPPREKDPRTEPRRDGREREKERPRPESRWDDKPPREKEAPTESKKDDKPPLPREREVRVESRWDDRPPRDREDPRVNEEEHRGDRDRRHRGLFRDTSQLGRSSSDHGANKGPDEKADGGRDGVKHSSSDRAEVSRIRSYFQHDDRRSAGHGGRDAAHRAAEDGRSNPKERSGDKVRERDTTNSPQKKDENTQPKVDDTNAWKHDGYYELEAEVPLTKKRPAFREKMEADVQPAKKRPAFREKKVGIEEPAVDATESAHINPARHDRYGFSSGRREERRGYNSRWPERYEGPPVEIDRGFKRGDGVPERPRIQRYSNQPRERYDGEAGTRVRDKFSGGRFSGRNSFNPGGFQVEKWKHDMYDEANRSPTPKNEEDQIAKVEALLAS